MGDELVPSWLDLLAEAVKLISEQLETLFDGGIRAEIIVLQQKRDRVVIVLPEVLRRVCDLANLQNHLLVEHPIEVAEQYGSSPPHASFVVVAAVME